MRIYLAIFLGISATIAAHFGLLDAGSTGAKTVTITPTETCGNSCVVYRGKMLHITNNWRKASLPPTFKAAIRPRDAYSYTGVLIQ